MSKKILLGTLFASLLTAGTAFADHTGPSYVIPARASEGQGYTDAQHRYRRWTSLGEIVLGGRRDRDNDTLHVGRDDGRISQLRLVVKRGHAFLAGARLTLGNGQSMFVDLRGQLRDGVAMIDLPGNARFVRSIELVPITERRGFFGRNRAVIEVLAQKAMTPPPWARL